VKKSLIIILTLYAIASAQQKHQVAVLPSVAERNALDPQGLILLTDKVRELATKNLPMNSFILLKQDAIVNRLGEEELFRACKEGVCVAELTKKISADYGARCDIIRRGNDLAMKFELYSVRDEAILETFTKYPTKDLLEMLAELEARLPDAFKKMAEASKAREPAGGTSYAEYGERNYTVNVNTTPQGANLRFNGIPVSGCAKSPCNIELPEGKVRILATLTQYETADTTVAISQNDQNISIKLKTNAGILAVKPAYSENIGSNKGWDLTINGKDYSSYENALSVGNYAVELRHECYEDISLEAIIAKDRREILDLAQHLKLKTGTLILSAERNGKPVSEPFFVNGRRVGETHFNGAVPVCADITIGNNNEKVNVTLAHNQTVQHKHVFPDMVLTDSRDKIQEQQELERARELQQSEAEKAQKHQQKKNFAFRTAIGFDIAGAGVIAYGLIEHVNLKKHAYDGVYSKAEKSEVIRNTAYIIGGTLLITGISIHIIFLE